MGPKLNLGVTVVGFALFVSLVCSPAGLMAQVEQRKVVVISDLHMGLGKTGDGDWHPTEDFRWPCALEGFLEAIDGMPPIDWAKAGEEAPALDCEGSKGGDKIVKEGPVDLVIAGDFLELWQTSDDSKCDEDLGCTVQDMEAITKEVLKAHSKELDDLARFAAKGGNCLVIVPGNHDAALVLPSVWSLVEEKLSSRKGCVERAPNGRWHSSDSKIAVEHGHQVGKDPNKYPEWPLVLEADEEGVERLIQPWGEKFVRQVYTEEVEKRYPLIDNLSPHSAGVRYRLADGGVEGTARDIARFLKFNLLETSFRQKVGLLGGEEEGGEYELNYEKLRKERGHRLFLDALDSRDPLIEALESKPDEWKDFEESLDALALELSDEEVAALCVQIAERKNGTCRDETLGGGLEKLLFSRRLIVAKHLEELSKERALARSVSLFAYGHTHSFELEWEARIAGQTRRISNSGAFQRLIDDSGLPDEAMLRKMTPIELLKSNELEKLPACYSFILFEPGRIRDYETRVAWWYMREEDKPGMELHACNQACPSTGHGCD